MDKRCVNYGSSWCADFECSECPVKDFRHEPVQPTCQEKERRINLTLVIKGDTISIE